jgi:hypothetical protein
MEKEDLKQSEKDKTLTFKEVAIWLTADLSLAKSQW